MIWDNDKRLRSTTKIYRDDFVIMNTDNKIHLSHGRRDLQKQLSSGVHDLNNPEHFPAFPGSPVHGAGERGLNHLRTSFKQVVESKLEAQSPSVNVEAPDGLFTASPRIGARRQPEAAEQPEQSIQANPQQVECHLPPAYMGNLLRRICSKVASFSKATQFAQSTTHLDCRLHL